MPRCGAAHDSSIHLRCFPPAHPVRLARPAPPPTPLPTPFLAVGEVLSELRRLMPAADPVATLLGDPSWLLRVERGRKRLGDDPDT